MQDFDGLGSSEMLRSKVRDGPTDVQGVKRGAPGEMPSGRIRHFPAELHVYFGQLGQLRKQPRRFVREQATLGEVHRSQRWNTGKLRRGRVRQAEAERPVHGG